MADETKEELIEEIRLLQKRIAELETLDSERKQQQREEEGIRRLATVVRDSNDAVTLQDLDGRITAWNRGAELMYGYSEKEALGMNIEYLTPPGKVAEQKEFTRRLIGGEVVTSFETQRVTKEGNILDVWLTVTKLVDDTGKPIGTASTERDITEQKRKEEVLRESESRYRLLADNAMDIIWTSDMNLSFTYFSPSVMQVLGYTVKEILTKRVEDFLTPDSIQLAGRVLLEEIAKDSLPGADLSRSRMLELQHIRKDGAIIWVQILMSFLRDQAHRPIGILGITRDITERKKQEEQIRHAAEEWRTTFDSITDLVSIIDREFRLVKVNKATAHAFGVDHTEIIGKTCYELMHGSKEPWPDCPHKKTLETGTPTTVEFFNSFLRIYLEVSTSPIFDDKGKVVATVHIAKDITQRKEMEKSQRLAQLGGLIAAMAHEVNNPLMIISGNAQLCLMEEIQSDTVKNNLKIIVEECRRAKDIIQRLLKFSRPSKGEIKEADINKNIEAMVDIVEHQFKLINVEIKRNYQKNLPLISIDEPQMQEVFMNLINNASEAMPGGGAITITTSLEGDFLRLDFKDTGSGMTEEAKKRLFEPFFTTKEKGTGLGLAVCYGIIKAHNGELKFESKLNKGTTATVLLPLGGVKHNV